MTVRRDAWEEEDEGLAEGGGRGEQTDEECKRAWGMIVAECEYEEKIVCRAIMRRTVILWRMLRNGNGVQEIVQHGDFGDLMRKRK